MSVSGQKIGLNFSFYYFPFAGGQSLGKCSITVCPVVGCLISGLQSNTVPPTDTFVVGLVSLGWLISVDAGLF